MSRTSIRVTFDASDIERLSVDLSRAPGRIQRAAPRTLRRGVKRLEAAMKVDASGHRYLPKFAMKITSYQIDSLGLDYKIGFTKGGQGNLAHIIVFGSVNNAPVYDFTAPLRHQTPLIVHELSGAATNSVFGGPK